MEKNEFGGTCGMCGVSRSAYRVLAGKPGRNRPFRRRGLRREDNIKMGIQEVGWGDMDWIDLARDRDKWRAVVNVVMNLQVPLNGGNLLTS